jgi:hypothetical protein
MQDRRRRGNPQSCGHPSFARGGGRQRVFWVSRFECLRGGRQDGQTKVVLLHQGFLGEQFGRCVRRQGQLRDLNSRFAARRGKTGAEVFALDTKFPVFASIAISNGMLYSGALDGKLTAVDLNTQKAAWVFQNDTSKQNLAAVQNADGTLNFGAIMSQNFCDDMVIAVSKLLSIGSILSWPVVVKDVTYVGSADGNLYALD